jgi:hypothetical protein
MEANEFIDRLLSDVTPIEAPTIDFASDVERVLAEQVVFLRGHLASTREDSVLGSHELVRSLYARLEDKDQQISDLLEEIRFLRRKLDEASS